MRENEINHLSDAELMLYARQILLPDWDVAAQLRLLKSHVVIIGMGGLGCPVAQSLVRAGVGKLTLIDDDVVETSNLQRQNLFFQDDVAKPKAMAAASRLAVHNPFVTVHAKTEKLTLQNSSALLKNADLILDCTDNFTVRDVINKTCVQHKLAFVSAAAVGLEGQLAVYDFSKKNDKHNEQACYNCVFGGADQEAQRCSELGVLTTTTQVIGNLAAHAALQFLGLQKNPLQNKLLVWQGNTMVQKIYAVKKDEHCLVCGS